MRRGGSLIVLIASLLAIGVLTQADLSSCGPMEKDQSLTCLAFTFAVLVLGALGMFVENPAPGYLCLAVAALGTVLAPVSVMPFLGLAVLGAVFATIGGHIDAHKNRKARLAAAAADTTKTTV